MIARTAQLVWYATGRFHETASGEFTFGGSPYDFRDLIGYGITQWGLAAPEPLTPPPPYQSVVPFVGSAIRVG